MAFNNRIRLPMQLHSAQFPEERNVFRKANGVTKTLSVIIRKQYDLETDFLPEHWHQRLKIALAHDVISWEGERYLGEISQDGDYTIEWPEGVLHYPTAKAVSKVQVTPFNATNSNCMTCEEASQLNLVDDEASGGGIYGTLAEDTDYEVDTAANDVICCYPAVFSLVSFNSDYLTSASIDPATGLFSFHTGTGLTDVNGLLIATYRVTCPNGGYDEAGIYADIDGSVDGCLAPTNLAIGATSQTSMEFTWTQPFVGADYYLEIYEGTAPVGSPVQTGNVSITDNITINDLEPGTEYYFQIRTECETVNSNFVGIAGETPSTVVSCGEYEVINNSVNDTGFRTVDYLDCNGDTQHQVVFYQSRVFLCFLEDSPGTPSAVNPGPMIVNYIAPC